MKKMYHLGNCTTCQAIIKETGVDKKGFAMQDIKFEKITASQLDEMKKANIQFEVTNVTLAEDGNSAVVEAVVLGSVDLEKGGVKDSVDTKTNLVKIQDKWLVEFKLK